MRWNKTKNKTGLYTLFGLHTELVLRHIITFNVLVVMFIDLQLYRFFLFLFPEGNKLRGKISLNAEFDLREYVRAVVQ